MLHDSALDAAPSTEGGWRKGLRIRPRVRSLRSSFGDTTPCRMTGVTLHGVVSPEESKVPTVV